MRRGIGVSPGVVVGVAHRVESVFGPFEQQTLESPSLVADEVERFERAVAEAAAYYEGIHSQQSPRTSGIPRPRFSRATCRSSTIRRCGRRFGA